MQQRWDSSAHGLRLTHAFTELGSPRLHRARSDDDVVRLHFGLQGDYSVTYPMLSRSFDLRGPHVNLLYMAPFEFEFVNQSTALETFGIQFPVEQLVSYVDGSSDLLSRFCDRVGSGKRAILFDPWPAVTPRIASVIHDVLHCRFTGALRDVYLLSKALELLVETVQAGEDLTDRGSDFSRGDRDKLLAAREFVDQRLTRPPSLSEVARGVGLNEYKLKRGFKQLFGSTVFTYLSEQRLELAKRRLLDTDKDVAEIAFELGYATPQHFGNAFKRRFGVPPNSIRKNPSLAIRIPPIGEHKP